MTETLDVETVPPADFDPLAPDADAPYGYTRDRKTGERRAKKLPGRPRAESEPEGDQGDRKPVERTPDREPGAGVTIKGGRRQKALKEPEEVPAFRHGPIAKGMNKLYFKVGKIVRGFDPEVGQAMIDATKKESEDDVTVGEAWEEIARTNPRIRKFLLKLISGGAWGQLFMAHAPILLAVIMKPAVISRIPFAKVIESMAEADEDSAPGEGGLPGGMNANDADQVLATAKAQMARMGLDLPPDMMAQAQQLAAQMAGGTVNGSAPVSTIRQQPRSSGSRAGRRRK